MRKALVIVFCAMALLAVSQPATAASCVEQKFAAMAADFADPWWPTFSLSDFSGPDHNWNGVPDPYEVALLAQVLCSDPAAQAVYDANLVIGQQWCIDDPYVWGPIPLSFGTQIAAYASLNSGGTLDWYLWTGWLTGLQALPNSADLAPDADYDGDGMTNGAEALLVIAAGGTPTDFAVAATSPVLLGVTPESLPVGSLVGFGLLGGACVFGGIAAIRGKQRR